MGEAGASWYDVAPLSDWRVDVREVMAKVE